MYILCSSVISGKPDKIITDAITINLQLLKNLLENKGIRSDGMMIKCELHKNRFHFM